MTGTSAVTTNVRGVDVDSGALVGRTQDGDQEVEDGDQEVEDGDQEVEDEGAVWTASRTRTPRAAFLADRTAQKFAVAALASVSVAVHEFFDWLSATHLGGTSTLRRISDRYGVSASSSFRKSEDVGRDLLTVEGYRASGKADGISCKHDVLGEASRIELVALRLLNEADGRRSIPCRCHEITSLTESVLLLLVINNDEGPILSVLRGARPACRLEDSIEIGSIDFLLVEDPDRTKREDVVVGVSHDADTNGTTP
jgi:hypothetical protein